MLLLQYDFKIEFYKAKQSLEKDTSSGDSLIEEIPKIIINTQHGIHIDITISNEFSNYNFVKSKRTKIVLWNLPLDFTNDIEVGDIVKILIRNLLMKKILIS
ncbi:hypothetical protein BbuMM1_P240 (plasmid) [Borreliella burgdorferi]|nr:hypothetical protein BbuMM1_P240 [Borreliella burgdorferi]